MKSFHERVKFTLTPAPRTPSSRPSDGDKLAMRTRTPLAPEPAAWHSESSDDSVVHSPHRARSGSPLRRNASRTHIALEVNLKADDSAAHRENSAHSQPQHVYSATPSKNKNRFISFPAPVLGKIGAGGPDLEDLMIIDSQCTQRHWRAYTCGRIAHVVVGISVVLLLFLFTSPAGSLAPVSQPSIVSSRATVSSPAPSLLPSSTRTLPLKMLTVCTGNTCRSPMMLILLKAELQRLGLKELVEVDSAGTGPRAAEHRPASVHARTLFPVLRDHRSKSIGVLRMSAYDHIFCMTPAHKVSVLEQCFSETSSTIEPAPLKGMPAPDPRTQQNRSCEQRVTVYPGEGGLSDPYNKTLSEYQECAEKLRVWVAEVRVLCGCECVRARVCGLGWRACRKRCSPPPSARRLPMQMPAHDAVTFEYAVWHIVRQVLEALRSSLPEPVSLQSPPPVLPRDARDR